MKTFNYIPLYTYEDYKRWEGDWELINGYPHAMSPSPLKKHQRVCYLFERALDDMLQADKKCGECGVIRELDWIVSENTIVRPDIMIVCGEYDGYLKFAPELVVEVLSPSSSMKDFNNKYRLYELQKVKYYIIINPENKECNLFELQDNIYVQNDNLKDFSFHADCKIVFDIPSFVAQLNLD